MAFSFCFTFPLALISVFAAFTGKCKIPALEGVEFSRAWFYTEFFGDSPPSFHFITLVYLYDSFELYICHPAELQTHESVSGKLYRFDDFLDLRQWDPELSAQLYTEAVRVNFGLAVEAGKEVVEVCMGTDSRNCYKKENG
jgi:hypothetical protein